MSKAVLVDVAVAIFMAPVLKEGFCLFFTRRVKWDGLAVDRLGREASSPDETIRIIILEAGESFLLLRHSLSKILPHLVMISHDSTVFFRNLLQLTKTPGW